jgi:hypothetical protein
MAIELFENKAERYFLIKDGGAALKLSEADFNAMKKNGKSPLLTRLWEAAKRERQEAERPKN